MTDVTPDSGKILITGAGIISALGAGIGETVVSLGRDVSCIGELRHLRTEHREFPVGEVAMSNRELSEYLKVDGISGRLRTVLLGIYASREAVASAGLTSAEMRQAAFVNGTTVGGMDNTEECFAEIRRENGDTPRSGDLKYNDCGSATVLIADHIGPFGMVTTSSTACSSAANALVLGANMIKAGIADIVVAGGSESLSRFHLNGFNSLMILSGERCRPFDRDRNGINLGEGAAYLVLESERSARRRGVMPWGILSGYGNACDAFHQTASSESGDGPYMAMSQALEMAHLKPEDIDYVNAHGTGTPNNDISELAAMKRIWGDGLPCFSSTKGYTGHTTSASGAVEAVICLLSIRDGFMPGNPGFTTPIMENAVPVTHLRHVDKLNHVVNNSFGFGGNDTSVIISRYE